MRLFLLFVLSKRLALGHSSRALERREKGRPKRKNTERGPTFFKGLKNMAREHVFWLVFIVSDVFCRM